MKKIISTVTIFALFLSVFAGVNTTAGAETKTKTSGDFKYEVLSETDKTAEITDYTGSAESLEIPSTLDGYQITRIGDDAFYQYTGLTSVTIPDTVTSIGGWAFSRTGLTSVTIPDSVKEIDPFAFTHNSELESVVIGNHVLSIGKQAFYDGSKLMNISIPDSVTSIGDDAFGKTAYFEKEENWKEGVLYIGDCLISAKETVTSYEVKKEITVIADEAFDACENLTEITVEAENPNYEALDGVLFNKGKTNLIVYPVKNERTTYTIPDSVVTVSKYAFCGSTNLEEISIPNGVESIESGAFRNCPNLKNISIPASVKTLNAGAFDLCSSLKNINVDVQNTAYTTIDGVLFDKEVTTLLRFPEASEKQEYTIPDSVKVIDLGAFYKNNNLITVTIPKVVTEIGFFAFDGCKNLKSVTMSEGVTDIGMGAFYDCQKLESIKLPDSVSNIGFYTFANTKFYNTESNWENGVLYNNHILIDGSKVTSESYVIKEGTISIADSAFEECMNLKSVTVPKSVENIGYWAIGYGYIEGSGYSRIDGFKIYGYADSEASRYASEEGFEFVEIKEQTEQENTVTTKIMKPKTTTISKLQKGKKSLKVYWKKKSSVSGYQIQCSTSKKFAKSKTKTVTVKSNKAKTPSRTIKSLKAKKKYYVRVRTYKTVKVNGKSKKVYSSWSKVKSSKTK